MPKTLSLGEEIGKSGHKVVLYYCYKGTSSSHCSYRVAAVTDAGEDAVNQYGPYKTYSSSIAYFSWRSSNWSRGNRYVDILGDDDKWYRAGVNPDKSLYFSEHGADFVPPTVQFSVFSVDTTKVFPHIGGLEVYVDGSLAGKTEVAYDRRYYSRVIIDVVAGRHEIMLKPPRGYRIVDTGKLTNSVYLISTGSFQIKLEEYTDPCEGVTCDPTCDDRYNRYSQKCVDGVCVKDTLIESNSALCGYKPECTEGNKKAGYVCEGGKWVAYTPPELPEPPVVPPVEPPFVPPEPPVLPPVAPPKYLTPAQADERVQAGLPCYIKCTLPLLDTIPGIRYTRGVWVLPFFTITSTP